MSEFVGIIKIKLFFFHYHVLMPAALYDRLLGKAVLNPKRRYSQIHHIHAAASEKSSVKAILLDHFYRRRSHKAVYGLVHDPSCTDHGNRGIFYQDLKN